MKKLLIILILCMFLVPLASADMQWDNVKTYDSETRTVTITNLFGLGQDYAEIQLLSDLNVVVPIGYQQVAEFEIRGFRNYSHFVTGMGFYNMKEEMSSIEKEFDLKARHSEEVLINNYTNVITDYSENGTAIYSNIISGTYYETQYTWETLNPVDIAQNENLTIGIFTEVQQGDYVDWIPSFAGVEVPEWASWTASLDVGLITYYKFDEGAGLTGLIIDELGTNNATNNQTTNTTGLYNSAYNYSGGSMQIDNSGNEMFFDSTEDFSISTWVNLNSIDVRQHFIGNIHSTSQEFISLYTLANNSFVFTLKGDGGGINHNYMYSNILATTGSWYHILGTYDAGTKNQSLYVNGVLQSSSTAVNFTGDFTSADDFQNGWVLGRLRYKTFSYLLKGKQDEIGIWDRTLSNAEAVQLYNGGNGIEFNVTSGTTVTLDHPTNDSSFIPQTIAFNATHKAIEFNLTNSTLMIWHPNGTLYATNSTTFGAGINSLFTNQTISSWIVQDDYLWNYETCSSNATGFECSSAENNFTLNIQAFEINSQIFNTTSNETDSKTFVINITTIPTILSVSANLNYNGTLYLGETSCTLGVCVISRTIDIPLIDTGEYANKTFFWDISVFDGTSSSSANTPTTQQNVSRIHLEACNATYTDKTLNFTAYDEQTLEQIDPFIFDGTFEMWLGGGSVRRNSSMSNESLEFHACLDPGGTFKTDAIIDYDEESIFSNYTNRFYYLDDEAISHTLQDISLYLLESSEATSFILKVQDDGLLPVTDALIEIHKYYPGEGIFRIVQIAKTDDSGKSVGFFETENVDYKFIIKKNGVTLLETTQQKIVPETAPFTLTFNTGTNLGEPWTSQVPLDNLTSTLEWNETSGVITYTYIDTSGSFTLGRVIVTKESLVNFNLDTTICDTNSSIASATITCTVGTTDGFYTASGIITRGTTATLDKQFSFQIESLSKTVGLLGLFYGWFLILISVFMFKFNEIAGIWAMTITIFLVNITGLISFGAAFVTAIIAIALIITWVMER